MKNIKLSVKLIGGFCITAFIVVVVGVTALIEQENLRHDIEILEEDALPAFQSLLTIKSEISHISALMSTLLTPYATIEQRRDAQAELQEARKIYAAAKDEFETLAIYSTVKEEWRHFLESISLWADANNKAIAFSDKLLDLDIINPARMNEHVADFEIENQMLLVKISQLLDYDIDFPGGTEATSCRIGTWLANVDTRNPEINSLAAGLRPIHTELHQRIAEFKLAVATGDKEGARQIFHDNITPLAQQISAKFDTMKQTVGGVSHIFEQMNLLILKEAAVHRQATFDATDAIMEKVKSNVQSITLEAAQTAKTGKIITLIGIIFGTVLALVFGTVLSLSITKPLTRGVELAQTMAGGDFTKGMDLDQKDEIGVLASSLDNMAKNLRSMIADLGKGIVQVNDSSNQLAAVSSQMASSAENTAARSNQVAAAAEQMSANQDSVAAAMEEASVNVNMVASATEEMSATIGEISRNASLAKDITSKAVGQSSKASERVDELGKAADEINKVTEAINEISEQTNLLALNATIEAARAGEAGKGFAVVANEIKDLAKQTAVATMEIKNKIQGIQNATTITVSEINEIAAVIVNVDQIVATIAAAVEEQTATTREIAANVTQVSQGIAEVNQNVAQSSAVTAEIAADIAEVNSSANEMNSGSALVKNKADELSAVADRLKTMVAKFSV